MADFVLKVSPEQMLQQADLVKKEAGKVILQFKNVENTVKNSTSYWEGQASDLHCQVFNKISVRFETLSKSLMKRPDDLTKMAGLYNESEQQATQDSAGLPSNIIL